MSFPSTASAVLGATLCFALRMISIRRAWQLPGAHGDDDLRAGERWSYAGTPCFGDPSTDAWPYFGSVLALGRERREYLSRLHAHHLARRSGLVHDESPSPRSAF